MTEENSIRVVEIRESARRPGRYELALDGAVVDGEPLKKLTVSVDLIAEMKLKPGRRLSDAELHQLSAGARLTACYDKALATLGARARSAADLKRWLKTKDFTEAEISPALEKLQALGLVDDRAFALGFARSRLAPGRGFGPRRIAAELARRGVARSVTDSVLAELDLERREADDDARSRGESTQSAAELAAAKKIRSLSKLDPAVAKRRLHGYLARRGFGGAEISNALKALRQRSTES